MSYHVLARKWRPYNFDTFVGQLHVVRALTNALQHNRLHHAYLFTGTRGVGKTTLARILAKCFNCEAGVGAKPCEQCANCTEVTQGCFVDLIEVDAASRTKVEDTRDLLDNVQYAPTRGRFKIYLIDEVHMLSTHSFNALLKTLEEPPPHVKFLLATTDPQRLPITVLSRCLQFNLKNIPAEEITTHLEFILNQENISFEKNALWQLARAAQGSLRDALSLLDQAIAYGDNKVAAHDVQELLGTIEQTHIHTMLHALAEKNAQNLFNTIQLHAEQTHDFQHVLEELLTTLHRLALGKQVPDILMQYPEEKDALQLLIAKFSAEELQLYYQIALIGRRDLPLAPTFRIGFEMVLLRMLAFHLDYSNDTVETKHNFAVSPINSSQITATVNPVAVAPPTQQAKTNHNDLSKQPIHKTAPGEFNGDWNTLIAQLKLSGAARAIVSHCSLKSYKNNVIELQLDPSAAAMLTAQQEQTISAALKEYFQKTITLKITAENNLSPTPKMMEDQQQLAKQQKAEQTVLKDEKIQHLIEKFAATIIPESLITTDVAPE